MKTLFAVLMVFTMPSLALSADVTITKKKAWSTDGQSGYVVSYKHDGNSGKMPEVGNRSLEAILQVALKPTGVHPTKLCCHMTLPDN